MTPEQKIAALAQTFPSTRDFPGTLPWDALKLAACYGTASGGARQTIAFLLTVWNMHQDLVPPFNVVEATERWDCVHRRAFADWAARPFTC